MKWSFLILLMLSHAALAEAFPLPERTPDPLDFVEVSVGMLETLQIGLNQGFGLPSTDILFGVTDGLVIGPEGGFVRTSDYKSWGVGLRATYFLNNRRFTDGFIVSVFNREGGAVSSAPPDYGQVNGTNIFSQMGAVFGYNWTSNFVSKQIKLNALVGAGLGFANNSNCDADPWCGERAGADSWVSWNGQGFVPEVTARVGISF